MTAEGLQQLAARIDYQPGARSWLLIADGA